MIEKVNNLYVERYALISFEARKICIRNRFIDEANESDLDNEVIRIDLKEVIDVKRTRNDNQDTQSTFEYKTLVFTQSATHELFVKNESYELDFWLEYFCKIIDLNDGLEIDCNTPSQAYQRLLAAEALENVGIRHRREELADTAIANEEKKQSSNFIDELKDMLGKGSLGGDYYKKDG